MGVKVTFSEDFTGKVSRELYSSGSQTEHILAIQAAKDTEPFVPMLTGSLKNRTRVVGGTIIYPGPYARYLYNGKLMVDPATGSSWARRGARKKVTDKNLSYTKAFHPMAQDHWFEASKALNDTKWVRVAGRAMKRELGE